MWGPKAIIKTRLDAFAKQFSYDMGYAHQILDTGMKPFRAFSGVFTLAAYRDRQLPLAPWFAAKWVAVQSEGCGPCQQLTLSMAQQEGMPASLIKAIKLGDEQGMGPDAALAYRWARAVISPQTAHESAHEEAHEAEQLRQQIKYKWGERGLISLTLAMAGARSFPMIKRALGHNAVCQLLDDAKP